MAYSKLFARACTVDPVGVNDEESWRGLPVA